MLETLKKYWFVVLVAVLLTGFLGYYVVDITKDNVSSKSSDGKDVVASLSIGDVTSEELFDEYQQYSDSVLYNMYRNAIIDQAIETTDDLKAQQKTFQRNIESNVDADASGQTRIDVITELASFGFVDMDQLPDYCMMYLKSRELDRQFVKDNIDKLASVLDSKPKTISIIKQDVADAAALSEEELDKQNQINEAIEADGFGEAAIQFSDDLNTAANMGFYGYIDQNSTDLDGAILEAIADLGKDQITDWITVTDAQSGTTSLYKVQINEDNFKDIFLNSETDVQNDALTALITADNVIEIRAVESKAGDFEISFADEEIEKRVRDYIDQQLERDAQTFAELSEQPAEEVNEEEAAEGEIVENEEAAAQEDSNEAKQQADQENEEAVQAEEIQEEAANE